MDRKEWYREVFLNSPEWKKTRDRVIERDGHKCFVCGRTGRLEVHHTDYGYGGERLLDPSALVTLCHDCHASAHSFADELLESLQSGELSVLAKKVRDSVFEFASTVQEMVDRRVLDRNLALWEAGKTGWTNPVNSPNKNDVWDKAGFDPQILSRYVHLLFLMSPYLKGFEPESQYRVFDKSSVVKMAKAWVPSMGAFERYQNIRLWVQGRKIKGLSPQFNPPEELTYQDAVRDGNLFDVLRKYSWSRRWSDG